MRDRRDLQDLASVPVNRSHQSVADYALSNNEEVIAKGIR
jgi:hypothetical protein